MLHCFILSNMPIAAVFEWNILSMYAGFFLFWHNPEVSLFSIDSIPMILFLIVACLIVPFVGNFVPRAVSFLLAMRYYAGNWAWNAWLFEGDSYKKLECFKRAAPLSREQLEATLTPGASAGICREDLHRGKQTLSDSVQSVGNDPARIPRPDVRTGAFEINPLNRKPSRENRAGETLTAPD